MDRIAYGVWAWLICMSCAAWWSYEGPPQHNVLVVHKWRPSYIPFIICRQWQTCKNIEA